MRPSTRKWLLGFFSLLVLSIATTRLEPLNVLRKKHHLVLPPLAEETALSTLYTPLLALGRAPLVDVLWIQALKFKDEGRYFDALQYAQLICDLQPKFASVWVFQAWNMAYNISVTLKSPEERWRWVRNGYELLRDKAIPLNPHNTQLYRNLAWTLFHKVGDFMDDWHHYYKLQFALEMEDILGEPPEGFVRPGRVRGDYYREYDYQPLAQAPLRFKALPAEPAVETFVETLAEFGFDVSRPGVYLGLLSSIRGGVVEMPDTPAQAQENRMQALLAFWRDPEGKRYQPRGRRLEPLLESRSVRSFIDRLRQLGFDATKPGVYLRLLEDIEDNRVRVTGAERAEREARLRELLALMADEVNEDARQAVEAYWRSFDAPPEERDVRRTLEHFWRAQRLRNEVKLDPARIVALRQEYGVGLDYRLAESHALYWANLGLEMGTEKREAVDIHKLNTNRIEFYCLQKMFHRGRMAMSKNAHLGEPPLLSPDIRVVPVLFQAFLNDSEKYLKNEKTPEPISTNFKSGFVGFSRSAILRYHELDMNKEALELFGYLREHVPDPMYEEGLDGFLKTQVEQDRELNDFRVVMARIEALVGRGLIRYAYDEDEEAVRYVSRARQVYDRYQKSVFSSRQEIKFSFREIVENLAHSVGGQMYPRSYEHICAKLGIEPLPRASGGEPAAPESN